jgi:hypothetical protein
MKKRYWLRGGAIGFIIWFLLVIIQTFTFKSFIGVPVTQNWWNDVLFSIGVNRIGGGSLESWILTPFSFLIIGIIFGWFYEKIKNGNKTI